MSGTPNSVITPQTPRSAVAQIVNADGTNLKALVVGGANNSKISAILAANTDSSAHTVQLSRNVGGTNTGGTVTGGTNYMIATVAVAANAGNAAATPPVALMTSATIPGMAVDVTTTPYLYLDSGEFLCVALLTGAVGTGNQVAVHATVADF